MWRNMRLRKAKCYAKDTKKGKLSTSHRYNLLPLLPSGPGGIQRELVVYDFPRCKYRLFMSFCQLSRKFANFWIDSLLPA